jgi:hypothetical protein
VGWQSGTTRIDLSLAGAAFPAATVSPGPKTKGGISEARALVIGGVAGEVADPYIGK